MKHTSLFFILMLAALTATVGCSSNAWDEVPQKITTFISQYFPGQGIRSYSVDNGTERLVTSGGTSLEFDANLDWTIIDANGHTLPQTLLYDELPPALFQYLEETENLSNVYKLERTSAIYIITLKDTYITYDIATGAIKYPKADDAKSAA